MRKASVRDLHIRTSELVRDAAGGAAIAIERRGEPREILRKAESLASSALAIAEVTCAFHRRLREGNLTGDLFREVLGSFLKHVEAGAWSMAPVNDGVLHRVSRMLRLAAAPHFGLIGRTA